MAARIKDHATYDDLLRAPENMVAELIDGELYTWPRPRGRHGDAYSTILGRINVYTGSDIVCAEPFTAVEIDLARVWGADPE